IERWLDIFANQITDCRAEQTNLIFLGGEPTLHPDLAQAVKSAREKGFKSITIDTNGYLFHNILDKVTPEDVDVISFSLDGATRETNDAIRGDGCWDAVMNGIEKAAAKGFACSMIYTVSEKNIHELERMPDLVKQLDISRFFIQVVGIRGETKDTEARDARHQVSKDTWLTVIPKVAEQIARNGTTVIYPKVFLQPDETFECAARVARNYFVFPNGRVYQCPVCEDFPLHSYEIKDGALVPTPQINETDLFGLDIPEGCVMNKMIQPGNLAYDSTGTPCHKIACCLLKEEITP
ncbi:MAG: radical SAM protein, partial [Desulfobacterales bacterium]|nr:radical SAM protein [Desulfobacterales bacterium]